MSSQYDKVADALIGPKWRKTVLLVYVGGIMASTTVHTNHKRFLNMYDAHVDIERMLHSG